MGDSAHVRDFAYRKRAKTGVGQRESASAWLSAALSDKNIDLTDIHATYGVAWKRPGSLIPEEIKRQITSRIDADVLSFFKETGRRYQTRMNDVLRSYMDAQEADVTARP